jgi:hypothetical protein
MSDYISGPNGPGGPPPISSLTDRLMARLSDPALTRDQPSRLTSRKPARRRSDHAPQTPEQVQQAHSLRRVFREMGDAYRDYRGRTGQPVEPEIRKAAYRFRRERSVASLVSVAERLDELHILAW